MSRTWKVMSNKRRLSVMSGALFVAVTATLLNVIPAKPANAAPPPLVSLHTYINNANGDRALLTTAPVEPGYQFLRLEGRIFSANGTQPLGTKALYSWYSAGIGDYISSTDAAWKPASATDTTRPGGYQLVRLEGYVHDQPRLGTLPLRLWYSGALADNWTTGDPLADGVPSNPAGGYTQPNAAPQGYVIAPPESVPLSQFGWGTMRQNGFLAQGNRPLLVMAVDYSDVQGFEKSFAQMEADFFGTGVVTVQKFFKENSHGRFNWTNGGVIHVRYPGTFAQADAVDARPVGISQAVFQGYDWKQWDANGNNVIEEQELGVVYLGAHPERPLGGQTSGGAYDVAGANGLRIKTRVAGMYDTSPLGIYIHEVAHLLGATDLYGSDLRMSAGLTMMGSTVTNPVDWSVHLDPWHKMRLGWLEPSTYVLGQPTAACYELLNAAGATAKATLVYDPVTGPLDYLLIEYRRPNSLDKNLADQSGGLAVWHVQTHENFVPKLKRGVNGRGLDATMWNVGSPPDVGNPGLRGQSTLWRDNTAAHVDATNHEFAIREWNDDSGLRIRPGVNASGLQGTMGARLRHASLTDTNAQARIDSVSGTRAKMFIRGDLGMRQGRTIVLRRGATQVTLNAPTWRCSDIPLTIPDSVAAGNWELVIKQGAEVVSNPWPITI
jgi:M6 family metalloprotease-like protein